MRVLPVFAAALLLSVTPAMAKSAAPEPAAPAEQSGPASPPGEMRRNILNDIMDRMITDETGEAPNPFKNPGPRLISDGWAQRV